MVTMTIFFSRSGFKRAVSSNIEILHPAAILHQDRGLLLRLFLRARIRFVHRLSSPGQPVRVLAARCDKLNARKGMRRRAQAKMARPGSDN
jgi:hypothetical protein